MPIPRIILLLVAKTFRTLANFFVRNFYQQFYHTPLYRPTLTLSIPSTLSSTPGLIPLSFNYPSSYSPSTPLPCIVNFHGGGFTIGTPLEDSLWIQHCVETLNCIVCSVDYRLAPEFPYPTAVQDGVDALFYLRVHREELGIDEGRMATSGFSAGGNLAVTVPILARDLLDKREKKGGERDGWGLKAVMAWYPGLDRTTTREEKLARMSKPEKALPNFLTKLFMESYLPLRLGVDKHASYISPAVATDEVLRRALPEKIVIWTCEHDLLCPEGAVFAERLKGLGKDLNYGMAEGVAHGWDKYPSPTPRPEGVYEKACVSLREAFER